MPNIPLSPSRHARRNQQRSASFRTGLLIIGILVLWILFLPLQFGGAVSYVMIDGVSMTPVYKTGDLVIVRKAPNYQIGDIVTYEYPSLGRVIHRVIGRDGLRYIIKGDANAWIDLYQPTADEILGKEWIYLPGVGKTLKTLRSPGWIAGLVFFGVLMFGISDGNETQKRRRGRLKARVNRAALGFGKWLSGTQEIYFGLAFTLGLGAIVLGIFSFTRPIWTSKQIEIPYEQFGLYSYMGNAPQGVYDETYLKSGDAIFPQVTCNVRVMFNYQLFSSGQTNISGKHHLTAVVSDGKGWNRTIELQPESQITSTAFQSSGDINFCDIRSMIEEVQEITGALSQTYMVTLSPNVEVQGLIDGLALKDSFTPKLAFQIEPNQIALVVQYGMEKSSVLQTSQSGLLLGTQKQLNALPIFSLSLSVISARWISVVGILIAILLVGWVVYVNDEVKRKDPKLMVELLSGQAPLIIQPETPVEKWKQTRIVKIASLEDLTRMANSLGALIELIETPDKLYFLVNDQGTCYQTVVDRPVNEEETSEVNEQVVVPEEETKA